MSEKKFILSGRTAVLTGAASGIGRALAVTLAARGTNLALVDRNAEGLRETASLAGGAVRVSTHVVDIADKDAIAALPAQVLASHPAVDIVINNAGVALGGTFEQLEERDFEWLFDINFWGVVRMTRAFLPLLKARDAAALVNVSSIFGIIAPPGQTAYSASKFAVRGFTMALRGELSGSNVLVSTVHPGGVATAIAANAPLPKNITNEERERYRKMWTRALKMSPEKAAEIIVHGIEQRKTRILVGSDARVAALAERLAPVSYGKLLKALGAK